MASEIATLGGGCFWCLEAVFERLRGVESAVSGYAGGKVAEPSYELVCTGATDHAEVVHVTFDPAVLTYRELLEIFFAIHDPATLNRQGADVGTQYRSVVFHHSPEQQRIAQQLTDELKAAGINVVTQLEPCPTFYPAETYHQGYFRRNPSQGYCQVVIAPKLSKFRKTFAEKVRD